MNCEIRVRVHVLTVQVSGTITGRNLLCWVLDLVEKTEQHCVKVRGLTGGESGD